jgi:hypothetical protein
MPHVFAPFMITPGFEGTPFLYLSGFAFLGLTFGSFILSLVLQSFSSLRTRAKVATTAAVLLFGLGILGPVILEAWKRAHPLVGPPLQFAPSP